MWMMRDGLPNSCCSPYQRSGHTEAAVYHFSRVASVHAITPPISVSTLIEDQSLRL